MTNAQAKVKIRKYSKALRKMVKELDGILYDEPNEIVEEVLNNVYVELDNLADSLDDSIKYGFAE